jgi:hypothetical protein
MREAYDPLQNPNRPQITEGPVRLDVGRTREEKDAAPLARDSPEPAAWVSFPRPRTLPGLLPGLSRG